MEIVRNVFSIMFFAFLIYTFLFILFWIVSLFVSSIRLSEHSNRRRLVKMVIPDKLAQKHPVSVIIPAYNESSCINKTIESLIKDDYPALKIIVVNDGSKDDTNEIVTKRWNLKKKDCKFKKDLITKNVKACYQNEVDGRTILYIEKENGGKADALNCGLNFCDTPYCVIVDADTQVEKGSIRGMVATFLKDDKTVVCAGVVDSSMYASERYKSLSFMAKALVLFQQLEYYRTFYMQRILFDRLNANIIVSGAFAMFDTALLKTIGGYRVGTIGEDMEITMRIHAFCRSQRKKYRIAYDPEIKCSTQMPFTYSDFLSQRRRWHIGMIQSLKAHNYMLINRHYGWTGMFSGTYILLYELFAPVIEIMGALIIIISLITQAVSPLFMVVIIGIYALFAIITQLALILMLRVYDVEKITLKENLWLVLVAVIEPLFFHIINVAIKIKATVQARKKGSTWKHIERV